MIECCNLISDFGSPEQIFRVTGLVETPNYKLLLGILYTNLMMLQKMFSRKYKYMIEKEILDCIKFYDF